MAAPNPPASDAPAPVPSLLDRIATHASRSAIGDVRISREGYCTAWTMLIAAGVVAVVVASCAAWQARIARAEIAASAPAREAAARNRERAESLARAFVLSPLDETLNALRTHLPPGIRLIEAARDEDGTLNLTVDTPDPDALRSTLAADAWLGRFRERAQIAREDGTIRVRLAGRML